MTQITEPTYVAVSSPRPRRRVPTWLWVLAAMAIIAGAGIGTFASFSASTTNTATFSTGAIVLSNTVDAGTACLSAVGTTDTNANNNCDALFTLATKKPGDSSTATLDLKNEGTINASALSAFTGTACAASNASGETYHGTGDPCTKVNFYIQEWTDGTRATASTCWFGGGTATTCAFSSSKTLGGFSSTYPSFGSALGLGAMTSNTTRYFTIGVQLDSSAGNDMQGRAATIGVSWRLVQ